MAPSLSSNSAATLRAISYRITSTPTEQLPLLASQISASLWNCRDLLSTPSDALKANAELHALVYRFKTSLSTLLQDRTVEGRWAAIVLTKATIEAGGVEVLSKSNNWVRALLSILKKPDPATTRILAVLTLSRIFSLTWGYTNLVREITTPALPGFVSTCLANASKERCSTDELKTIFEAFAKLLPRHPTIFRTHEAQIRKLLLQILSSGSTPQEGTISHMHKLRHPAQRLLVLLHNCAPKQGGGEQWDRSFQATTIAAHETCGYLFRSIREGWTSTNDLSRPNVKPDLTATEAYLAANDALGLEPWHGMLASRERLVTVLGILRSHLESATTTAVPIRIRLVVDLLTRLFASTVPQEASDVHPNPQVSKEEREQLFAILPSIHAAAIWLVHSLLDRFGQASISFVQTMMEQLIDVYRTESFDREIRESAYCCMNRMLQIIGQSLPKENIVELSPILRGCCDELLLADITRHDIVNGSNLQQAQAQDVAIQGAKSEKPVYSPAASGSLASASRLLATAVTKLNSSHMNRKLRTQIERTAVLTADKDVLLACIMNPARKETRGRLQPSLLPLLAGQFPDAIELEALVRPRIPPVVARAGGEGEETEAVDAESDENGSVQEIVSNKRQLNNGAYEGNMDTDPTTGLFDALTRMEYHSPEHGAKDELYTVTPPESRHVDQLLPGAHSKTMSSTSTFAKRPADETEPDAEASSKRLKMSPIAEPRRSDPATQNADSVTAVTGGSIATTVSGNALETICETTAATTEPIPKPHALKDNDAEDIGDDDSDFEMPPLTMESDTDPEDEDGGGSDW